MCGLPEYLYRVMRADLDDLSFYHHEAMKNSIDSKEMRYGVSFAVFARVDHV